MRSTTLEFTGASGAVPAEHTETVALYRATYPGHGIGIYSEHDWNRLLCAYRFVDGESVLDVGVGNGAFLHILTKSGRFRRICGVDIRRNSMLIVPDGVDFRLMSVTNMDLPDGAFDTVVCMEVLEHLEIPDLPRALDELRRVCRHRLICSLPYNEPYPLFKQDEPGGHRQSFDDELIHELFPGAQLTLVPRGAVPWVMVVEDAEHRPTPSEISSTSIDTSAEQATADATDPVGPPPIEPEPNGPSAPPAAADGASTDPPADADVPSVRETADAEPLDRVNELYRGEVDWGKEVVQACRDRVHWIVDAIEGPEVLDIGCSQGIVSILAARAGHRTVGVDLADESIAFARRERADESADVQARLEFHVGDAMRLDLPAAAHDTVIMGEILEHLHDPSTLVRRALELLRPGGRLVITTPFGHFPHNGHHTTFTLRSFVELLETCALSPIDLDVKDRYIRCVAVRSAECPERPEWRDRAAAMLDPRNLFEIADRGALGSQVILSRAVDAYRFQRDRLSAELKRAAAEAHRAAEAHQAEIRRLAEAHRGAEAQRAAEARRAAVTADAERRTIEGRLTDTERQLKQAARDAGHQKASAEGWKRRCAVLESSIRLRVGAAIVDAVKSPRALLRLPKRLWTIARQTRQTRQFGRSGVAGSAGSAAGGAVASDGGGAAGDTAASQRTDLDRLLAQFSAPYRQPAPKRLALSAVSILDEFSHECFAPELDLTPLTRRDWKAQIESARPAFALLESSWNGNGGEWKYAMTNFDPQKAPKLDELVTFCRTRGLPTVFWNKEDGLNYDVFIAFARRCDHVFTSDANCLERYRRDLGHDRVHALPFAAQPTIHNPVDAFRNRIDRICFAGAWYGQRHGRRGDDLGMILEAARDHGLDIFDRFFNHPDAEKYRYPDRFAPHVRGGLPYGRMLAAYRAYRAFINVNSVADSPTMFSRRVFELLACGTPVVSTESAGIREMLPGLVDVVGDADEAARCLTALMRDDAHWRRRSHLGYREVMGRHTYRHRVGEILRTIGMGDCVPPAPKASVITVTKRPQQLDHVLSTFAAQTHPNRELLLVLNDDGFDLDQVRRRTEAVPGVRVIPTPAGTTLGECLNIGIDAAEGDFIAKMDDDDHYGAHYLADALLPFTFTDAQLVGKHCHHCYLAASDELLLRHPGHEHRFHHFVHGGTMVGKAELFRDLRFAARNTGEDTDFLKRCVGEGRPIYAADAYNYVYVRHADPSRHSWRPEDDVFRRTGVTLGNGLDLERVLI